MSKTFYQILSIKSDATAKEIKQAYFALAKQYHPDMNNFDIQTFKKIKESYETLSDNTKRKKYDKLLKINNNKKTSPPPIKYYPPINKKEQNDRQKNFLTFKNQIQKKIIYKIIINFIKFGLISFFICSYVSTQLNISTYWWILGILGFLFGGLLRTIILINTHFKIKSFFHTPQQLKWYFYTYTIIFDLTIGYFIALSTAYIQTQFNYNIIMLFVISIIILIILHFWNIKHLKNI